MLEALLAGGLPLPVPQYEIWNAGRLVARPDFSYPDLRLALEADGYASHSRRNRWERDRARDARLTLMRWRVIRFSWSDIERRPRWVAETVRAAIAMPPLPV